ncbi:carboxylate-amine ligase [Amycolatopsis anabasis]|uniref:carboxylate-amine ligase n=1 Tax=Amycolatopsis anabasis TaxID=1840409 RepID=UPI00131C3094|nr:glutamate--cysteine ligase [Amycolatopsis anabasis]
MVDNCAYRTEDSPARTFADELTLGVEEEFLLVDETGRLSPFGPEVIGETEEPDGTLQRELRLSQIETATTICHSAKELLDQLRAMRGRLIRTATARGLRLMPSGTPVLPEPRPPGLTPNPRYRRMAEQFGAVATTVIACACHVHVAIPDRATGVQVCNHLRPWLPILLALSANSPFHQGVDTRYCSWRHMQWGRWPSAGPPPYFHSVEHYEHTVEALLDSGAMLDRGMLYWDVRLSDKQPTVEFRVCDVSATAAEAALVGAIVRGLVTAARHAIDDHRRAPQPPHEVVRANLWRAARYGLSGQYAHPETGRLTPMRVLVDYLAEYIRPALATADGDLEFVLAGLTALCRNGCGAQRQRAAFAVEERLEDVVAMLTRQANR